MQNKKKQFVSVCLVCPKAYALLNPACRATFGGAEVDLFFLGTELSKDPFFAVSFITADYGQPPIEEIGSLQVIKSFRFNNNPWYCAWKIWKACRKANADIYMIKTASFGVPLTYYFCKFFSRVFIYRTAHSDECNGTYVQKHPVAGRYFINAIHNADVVFTQNISDKNNLYNTSAIPSQVIPNGHQIPPASNAVRDIILWSGRTADFKHPERFLELARHFPEEQFVMICQKATEDHNYETLKQEASLIHNLTFHEYVSFSEISHYFARTKVFINTSDSEGFANTFIQAGAAGAAILSFAVNPDEFLTRYNCGLCCRGDMDKLKAGLAFLLDDQRYIEIGKNGRKYVEEKHDISTIVEQYKAIFVRLAEQKRRKR
ncbi:MAG: glycosyltransferase family 4 protein [Sedimentisphaerales bacterium]|nr:glycosyltransferase family 4 protein [Sedimentisphaerales bacterium]